MIRDGDSYGSSFFIVEHHLWNYKRRYLDATIELPKERRVIHMTNYEAKVYIQYIKVLLSKNGLTDESIIEALDKADFALDPEPVVKDPRFERI